MTFDHAPRQFGTRDRQPPAVMTPFEALEILYDVAIERFIEDPIHNQSLKEALKLLLSPSRQLELNPPKSPPLSQRDLSLLRAWKGPSEGGEQ